MKKVLTLIFLGVIVFQLLWLSNAFPQTLDNEVYTYYVENFESDTAARNAVTAIYLNYRVYDTLFEAFMLLISILAVIYFSRHNEEEEEH